MDLYSSAALAFSLLYIYFAIKNDRRCFPFGFIASVIWAYADIKLYNLKFDAGLQMFYAVMSIVGWYKWSNNSLSSEHKLIKKLNNYQNLIIILIGLVISFCSVMIMVNFTSTSFAKLDASTTIFSIIATFLLIYRYIDNWIYLLVCNVCYLYIYYSQGATILMMIMMLYVVLALLGYKSWKNDPNVQL